jgi:hypothetical protein
MYNGFARPTRLIHQSDDGQYQQQHQTTPTYQTPIQRTRSGTTMFFAKRGEYDFTLFVLEGLT